MYPLRCGSGFSLTCIARLPDLSIDLLCGARCRVRCGTDRRDGRRRRADPDSGAVRGVSGRCTGRAARDQQVRRHFRHRQCGRALRAEGRHPVARFVAAGARRAADVSGRRATRHASSSPTSSGRSCRSCCSPCSSMCCGARISAASMRRARSPARITSSAPSLIAAIGFYDGFFGPGTGSLLIFVFVRCYGYDFLHAGASARVVNVATNAAALSYFAAHGLVLWHVGAAMAACNIVRCDRRRPPRVARRQRVRAAGVHRDRRPADPADGVDCDSRLE